MNEKCLQPFITTAFDCFHRLSECSELKNYRIYRDPGALPRQPIQECVSLVEDYPSTATHAKQGTGKWILVVSAQRSNKTGSLVVKLQGWRHGSTSLQKSSRDSGSDRSPKELQKTNYPL
ncbi:MAG TPA: hypothetical protein V6D14_01035 [Coleofasciculaceae cyanobacterium]